MNNNTTVTFKELVASNLLAVCQETTLNMGHKIKSIKDKFDEEKFKRFKEGYKLLSDNWTTDSANIWFRSLAKCFNDPMFETVIGSTSNESIYDPFTIIKIIDKTLVGGLLTNDSMCYIVTNGKDLKLLYNDGRLDGKNSTLLAPNKHIFATPDEIMKCIQELTDSQWKTIMTDPLFAPIVNEALNTPVKLGDGNQINIDGE